LPSYFLSKLHVLLVKSIYLTLDLVGLSLLLKAALESRFPVLEQSLLLLAQVGPLDLVLDLSDLPGH